MPYRVLLRLRTDLHGDISRTSICASILSPPYCCTDRLKFHCWPEMHAPRLFVAIIRLGTFRVLQTCVPDLGIFSVAAQDPSPAYGDNICIQYSDSCSRLWAAYNPRVVAGLTLKRYIRRIVRCRTLVACGKPTGFSVAPMTLVHGVENPYPQVALHECISEVQASGLLLPYE